MRDETSSIQIQPRTKPRQEEKVVVRSVVKRREHHCSSLTMNLCAYILKKKIPVERDNSGFGEGTVMAWSGFHAIFGVCRYH